MAARGRLLLTRLGLRLAWAFRGSVMAARLASSSTGRRLTAGTFSMVALWSALAVASVAKLTRLGLSHGGEPGLGSLATLHRDSKNARFLAISISSPAQARVQPGSGR